MTNWPGSGHTAARTQRFLSFQKIYMYMRAMRAKELPVLASFVLHGMSLQLAEIAASKRYAFVSNMSTSTGATSRSSMDQDMTAWQSRFVAFKLFWESAMVYSHILDPLSAPPMLALPKAESSTFSFRNFIRGS